MWPAHPHHGGAGDNCPSRSPGGTPRHFVDDLAGAFAEVARVLRPGGRFVLGIGDPDLMRRARMLTDNGFRIRPVAELESALDGAGLPLRNHERVAHSGLGFHLLVSGK
ncbi:methyltransferase domain-containing protein [Amycolatopsis sp. NPDC024027]|uniref:class I SAM-dependent methyltransferase n=1 Tax=Amycolatopsis sp. NPDC024027 TaxID=3154327 RepID=UPI0033C11C5A